MGASLLNFRMNMVHSPYGRCVPSSLRQNASIGVAKMWWWESRDMILKSLLQTKKVKNNRNSSDHVSKGQIVSAGNWYQRIPYIGQWPKSRNCVRLLKDKSIVQNGFGSVKIFWKNHFFWKNQNFWNGPMLCTLKYFWTGPNVLDWTKTFLDMSQKAKMYWNFIFGPVRNQFFN